IRARGHDRVFVCRSRRQSARRCHRGKERAHRPAARTGTRPRSGSGNSDALPGAMIAGPLVAAAIVAWACLSAANAATVAIDVGHYREKPGATSARGRPELEYNRDLAEEIKSGLDALGHRTRVIGAAGDVRELWRRPRAAKGADFFISVHHDSTQA